jgi:exodeoxyribonuclease VII large subunit
MVVKAYKVSRIVEYMRDLLEDDMLLCSLWALGEISNFNHHQSGHLFFSIKDEAASLGCVIFKNEAAALPFKPKNGDLVQIYGRISLYKQRGDLRFIGEFMSLVGQGDIRQNLEELKAKLLAEGVFENRRVIPKYPEKIAIVTSPAGAAIADMLKIIQARNPYVQVVLVPVLVQGPNAPIEIASGVRAVNSCEFSAMYGDADVIIVGRGGGSAEDLWAFNSEEVARAVFASKIPVVSAVGHETDFTLCDFAADLRCATPTEAAQVVAPCFEEMLKSLQSRKDELNDALKNKLEDAASKLQKHAASLGFVMQNKLDFAKRELITKSNILEKISPMAVLQRGFVLVEDSGGSVVKCGRGLTKGQKVLLQFSDMGRDAEIL